MNLFIEVCPFTEHIYYTEDQIMHEVKFVRPQIREIESTLNDKTSF